MTFPCRVKILSGDHAGEFGVAEQQGDGKVDIFLDTCTTGVALNGAECEWGVLKARSLED